MKRVKKYIKYSLLFLFFIGILFGVKVPVLAEEGASTQTDSELEKIREGMMEEFDFEEIDEFLSDSVAGTTIHFREVLQSLLRGDTKEAGKEVSQILSQQVFTAWKSGRKQLAHLLLLAIAAAFFSNFTSIFQNRQTAETGFYILYLAVILICLEAYRSMGSFAQEKISRLIEWMQVFCPSFFLAVAFTGKSSSALAFYQIVLFLIYLVELVILHFLLPVIQAYGMVRILSCLIGEDLFSEFAELLEKAVHWSLKTLLAVVTGMSLIQGFLNPAIDSLKSTAVGRSLEAIPWVGDATGGTLDVMLGTAVVLKNGIGVAGMLLLLLFTTAPLLELVLLAVFYKLAAALIQPVSDKRITECVSSVSAGYQLLVSLLATTVLLFLLSITIVTAVTS